MTYAMKHNPEPLQPQHRHMLSWKAAIERFVEASQITQYLSRKGQWKDNMAVAAHAWMSKGRRGQAVRRLATGSRTLD